MDQISIANILFISFPEEILLAVLGILSIGKFSYLRNKGNYLRITFLALIMAFLSNVIRIFVRNEVENLLVSLIIFSLLFIIVLRFRFYESIMSALFALIVLAFTETPILLAVSSLSGISLDEALENGVKLFLFEIPVRGTMIALIFICLRFKLRIIDLESTTIKRKEYYLQLFVYIASIGTLIFLAVVMSRTLLFDNGDFTNNTTTLLMRLNIYLTLFVTVILTLAIRTTHEFYKSKETLNSNEYLQSLEYISDLVNENRYSEAKEAIESLKIHILKY